MTVVLRPFDGSPDAWGAHRASIFPHKGPSSYVQVTLAAATTPIAGDTVLASEAGLKYFDKVEGGTTDDGLFVVRPIPVTPSAPLPTGPSTTYVLQWIANKTVTYGGQNQTIGTEVVAATDLSAAVVRLFGIGR